MKRISDLLREHLYYDICGIPVNDKKMPSLDELIATETNDTFMQLMRNRLVMGAFRYGRMKDKEKGEYKLLESLKRKLNMYQQTGNLEYLVDAANYLLLEFTYPHVDNPHFNATDDIDHCEKTLHCKAVPQCP